MLLKYYKINYFQSLNICLYAFIGNKETDWEYIKSPLSDNVYFAGEHTDMVYIGSIQGAFYSGQKAARQIMKDREDTTTKPTSDSTTKPTSGSPCGPTYSAHHQTELWACLFVILQLTAL